MNVNNNVKTILTLSGNANSSDCTISLEYDNATTLCVDMFAYEQDEHNISRSEFYSIVDEVEKNVTMFNWGNRFKVKHINTEDEVISHFVLVAENTTLYDNIMYVTVSKTTDGLEYYGVSFYRTQDEIGVRRFVQETTGMRFLYIA